MDADLALIKMNGEKSSPLNCFHILYILSMKVCATSETVAGGHREQLRSPTLFEKQINF